MPVERALRAENSGPPFEPRDVLRWRDAPMRASESLPTTQAEFCAAFRGSPMKRATLRGLERNAATAHSDVGTSDDVDVLTRALDDPVLLVRAHDAST